MVIKVIAKKKFKAKGTAPAREVMIIEFPRNILISTLNKKYGRLWAKGLTGLRDGSKRGTYRLTLFKRRKPLSGGSVF